MMFRNGVDGVGRCLFGGYMTSWGPWGMIFGLGMVILLVSLVFMLLQNKRSGNSDADLLNLLKERYVSGEISEEEYLAKKNTLAK